MVVNGSFAVDELSASGSTATVIVGVGRILGKIDSDMKFIPRSSDAIKQGILFTLIRNQEIGADGKTLKDAGPAQWKIDTKANDNVVWLNLDTAIRYVTEIGNKTTVASTARNIKETLVTLGRYR
ncbi:MAG TPA: hypothetical protein VK699_06005 [Terriglobales bacterium]|jgi:hypothetical protein|nr:hypothetical protein [Terriglobales bacterium]